MTPLYELLITYTNDSCEKLLFSHYSAARHFWQTGISYRDNGGDGVQRVELRDPDGSLRDIWDKGWSLERRIIGLQS